MSKILLIAALLTVGVGVRLKPMVADDSPSARAAASPVSFARRASRDRTRVVIFLAHWYALIRRVINLDTAFNWQPRAYLNPCRVPILAV
jgi:hypothetical protein